MFPTTRGCQITHVGHVHAAFNGTAQWLWGVLFDPRQPYVPEHHRINATNFIVSHAIVVAVIWFLVPLFHCSVVPLLFAPSPPPPCSYCFYINSAGVVLVKGGMAAFYPSLYVDLNGEDVARVSSGKHPPLFLDQTRYDQLLLLIHAPVSATAFLYFDCNDVGQNHSFVRQDYKLECYEEKWWAFVPVAVALLVCFTFALPIGLMGYLTVHRKDLQTPKTRQMVGWLYARLTIGSEAWPVFDTFRKMILTGVLVYFDPSARAAAALLVCFLSTAVLNYTRPYKNNQLFWVCQGSFLCVTLKYLVPLFALASKDDTDSNMESLGVVLIVLDSIVFFIGILCICLLFLVFRKDIQEATTEVEEEHMVLPGWHLVKKNPGRNHEEKKPTRSIKRQVTIKGSLRYNVKVAMMMKKAKHMHEAHQASREIRIKKIAATRIKSKSRLSDRIKSRSRNKLGKQKVVQQRTMTAVRDGGGLDEIVVTSPVQVAPER